jgi:branched-subunit amino acid aminotransferase/4-amino-4-deoxychorismate lyase
MQPRAYFNGQWVPAADLQIPFTDLGFLQGVTVVERLRTFLHQPFRLEAHLQRLRRSLEIVGWDVDPIMDQLEAAMGQLLPRNRALLRDEDDWSMVVLVTPGSSASASKPTLCVHGGPLPFTDWARLYQEGVAVVLPGVRQVPTNCWPSELKCRSRMHYYLADRQATAIRPGARAILLDQSGYLAEASTANVVAYFKNRGLFTPHAENVLPGISLDVLMELADRLKIPCRRDDISPEKFAQADEAFLTSTSACMLPIVEQNGRPIGAGVPGPTFARLLGAWSDLAGLDVAQQALRASRQGAGGRGQ